MILGRAGGFEYWDTLPTMVTGETLSLDNSTRPVVLASAPDFRQMDERHQRQSTAPCRSPRRGRHVAIARAIVHNPQAIFADEPTGNLDETIGNEVVTLLAATVREQGAACLLVTHNTKWTEIADRVVCLQQGKIYEGVARGTGIVELLVAALQNVVFLVCAACVFALFYLALRERSYELGVMRAIGHSKALMMAVLAGEGLVRAAAAAGLGLALVWAVCAVVPHLADRFTLALYLPAAVRFTGATMLFVLLAGHLVLARSIPPLMNDELGTR